MYSDDDLGSGFGAILKLVSRDYSTFMEKKNARNASNQATANESKKLYAPEDYDFLLDFNEDHIGSNHTLFCRYIPALATYFSSMATIDIAKDSEDIIPIYMKEVITFWVAEKEEQIEYADLFIKETINLVIRLLEDPEDRESNILFLKEQFESYHDNFNGKNVLSVMNEMIIHYALFFSKRMNPAAYSYLYDVVKDWGINKSYIEKNAKQVGFNRKYILFPELPIQPSDLSDILDFNKDPFCLYYHNTQHLYFCRVAPALAACLCIRAGINIYDYVDLKNYPTYLFQDGMTISAFSQEFINASIDAVYKRQDQVNKILYKISEFVIKDKQLRDSISFFALIMIPQISIEYFDVFFQFFGYTNEELNEICSHITTYEDIDFNQVKEFKNFSKD